MVSFHPMAKKGRPPHPEGSRKVRDEAGRLVWVVKVGSKWVVEHRLLMSQVVGRPLLRAEEVHHLDGDSLNNHPDNLRLMTTKEHASLHGLNGRWTKHYVACVVCGGTD